MKHTARLLAALATASLVLAACSGGEEPDPVATSATDGAVELAVIPQASYDLAVGTDRRVIFGVTTTDQSLIGGGTLDAQVIALASADATSGTLVTQAAATFLEVPGLELPEPLDQPQPINSTGASGVYELTTDLPQAGFYGLQVNGVLADGRQVGGSAIFQVAEESAVPAVGEAAPGTDNPTADDDVPLVALDSCAQEGNPCDPGNPDEPPSLRFPWLHQTSIAGSIDAGRPVVVLFATPVYCVSRFCGPITEEFAALARDYEDRAAFVHVEVWEDFESQTLSAAAVEWLQDPTGNVTEPWTFLIGADGTITQRWGNVLDIAELEALLENLPAA
jgi:hypothetical protein